MEGNWRKMNVGLFSLYDDTTHLGKLCPRENRKFRLARLGLCGFLQGRMIEYWNRPLRLMPALAVARMHIQTGVRRQGAYGILHIIDDFRIIMSATDP